MATPNEVLTTALGLLEDGGWCKGAYARDEAGESCFGLAEEAVSYCTMGAVYEAARMCGEPKDYMEAIPFIETQIGRGVGTWNDSPTTTFDHIRETFRRAIYLTGDRVTV